MYIQKMQVDIRSVTWVIYSKYILNTKWKRIKLKWLQVVNYIHKKLDLRVLLGTKNVSKYCLAKTYIYVMYFILTYYIFIYI